MPAKITNNAFAAYQIRRKITARRAEVNRVDLLIDDIAARRFKTGSEKVLEIPV